MAQTIEAFVGSALDEAKISPLHRRVIALIAAGYFFDVIDFTVFGSLVPYILQSSLPRRRRQAKLAGSAGASPAQVRPSKSPGSECCVRRR